LKLIDTQRPAANIKVRPPACGLSSKTTMATARRLWKNMRVLKRFGAITWERSFLLAGLLLAGAANRLTAQSDHNIYTDSLQNSWDNWSWSATVDFNSSSQVHTGSRSISATLTLLCGALI
jgi:hypothetical protein